MEVQAYQSNSYSLNAIYKKDKGSEDEGVDKVKEGKEESGKAQSVEDILKNGGEITQESAKMLKDSGLAQLYISVSVLFKSTTGSEQSLNKPEEFDYEKINSIMKDLDLEGIGYTGKPINELSADEAAELVSEDGFFGVNKTSDRVAGFVINGAGDDIDKLKAGREGVITGFKDAERIWGDKLPDIAYETQERTLKLIDDRIAELGGSILDSEA